MVAPNRSSRLPAHISAGPPTGARRQLVYALVGNPNCGKSTLFNALTGLKPKVGNYPGVTVEKKSGTAYSQHGQPMTVIDLPGAYSLAARSPDEAVTRDVLLGRRADTPQPDRILCIVDATNLERDFYLVHQILDLGRPAILVLNIMDIAPAVAELQASLSEGDGKSPLIARAEALLLLTDQDSMGVAGSTPLSSPTTDILHRWQQRWEAEGVDWAGTLVSSRYDAIGKLTAEAVLTAGATGPTRSDRIDA